MAKALDILPARREKGRKELWWIFFFCGQVEGMEEDTLASKWLDSRNRSKRRYKIATHKKVLIILHLQNLQVMSVFTPLRYKCQVSWHRFTSCCWNWYDWEEVNFLYHQASVLLHQELLPKHCRDNVSSLQTFRSRWAHRRIARKHLYFLHTASCTCFPSFSLGLLSRTFSVKFPRAAVWLHVFFLQTLVFIACCGLFLFVYSVNTIWPLSTLYISLYLFSLWNWRAKANLVEGITWDHLVQHHMWLDRIRIVPPEVSKESLYIIKCYLWFHLRVDGYGLRKTDPRVVQRGLLGGFFFCCLACFTIWGLGCVWAPIW